MSDLKEFWKLLEEDVDRSNIMYDWNAALGDAMQSLKGLLRPTDEMADLYPNPIHPEGRRFLVVEYKGMYSAVSHDREHLIKLEPKDVLIYRWDMLWFRRLIADALKITPASDTIKKYDRVIRLGNLALVPGEEYPVYMFLDDTTNFFRNDVSQLLLKLKTPFIVATGTRTFWDDNIVTLLRERNIPLLSLCEALEFRDGQFVPTDVWHGAMESFRKTLHPENLVAVPEYQFAKLVGWEIRFGKEKMAYGDDLLGLDYIQYLLKYPFKLIHGSELETASAKEKPEFIRSAFTMNEMKSMPKEETSSGNSPQVFDDNGVIDRQAREKYEKRLRELADERRQANANSDLAWLAKINAELKIIDSELNGSKNIFGRTVKLDKSEKLLAGRVAKNIRIAIEKISTGMPKFSQYLENAIHSGRFSHYTPHDNIDWMFS